MKYVLDTNTLSYLMRGDPAVVESLTACSRTDVLLPQPVIAEIEYGLARLGDSKRQRRLRERFDLLAGEFRRAAWSDDVSCAFGEVRIEDFDVAIAAHALTLDGTLVTDNLEHMERVRGLRLDNWRS